MIWGYFSPVSCLGISPPQADAALGSYLCFGISAVHIPTQQLITPLQESVARPSVCAQPPQRKVLILL